MTFSKYSWEFRCDPLHNLAVCKKIIPYLMLGVVWGNTDIDQTHNFEKGQIVDKLAAAFLKNTIGVVFVPHD